MARGIIKPENVPYISTNDGGVKKDNYDNDGAKTSGSIAIGPDALSEMTWVNADGSDGSIEGGIAIGSGATNRVTYTFDVGSGAEYLNTPCTVIGTNSSATGPVGGSVVIGTQSSSSIFAGTAIGLHATVTGAEGDQNFGNGGVQGGGVAIGAYSTSSYDGSSRPSQTLTPIAIGTVASATADGAIAIGEEASSSALKGYALGVGANVTAESAVTYGPYTIGNIPFGVALGAESKTTVDKNVAGYDPSTSQDSTDTSATWRSTLGAVAIGDGSSKTRQINSVAAGTKDTDAVNVAQLKAVSKSNSPIYEGNYQEGSIINGGVVESWFTSTHNTSGSTLKGNGRYKEITIPIPTNISDKITNIVDIRTNMESIDYEDIVLSSIDVLSYNNNQIRLGVNFNRTSFNDADFTIRTKIIGWLGGDST